MKVTLFNMCFPDYPVALANALAHKVDLTFIQSARLTMPWKSQIDPRIQLLVRNLPRMRDPSSLRAGSELLQSVCELEPDILHLQDPCNLWFYLIASLRHLPPTVVTLHDVTWHPGEDGGAWLFESLRNRLLKKAQAIIVHAAVQRDLLCSRWKIPRDRVHVIPHGEVGSLYRDAGVAGADMVRRDLESVLFFGRIRRYKGLEVLVAAMEIVRREIPAAKLIIAGTGDPISRYLPAGRNHTWIEFIDGFIPHSEVARLFSRAGISVLPYLEASQSGVACLALGLGAPVIASAIGGLEELIIDGVDGILVPPGDPAALALAITGLMRDEARQHRLSAAALARCRDDLAWNTIAAQTTKLYQQVLDS